MKPDLVMQWFIARFEWSAGEYEWDQSGCIEIQNEMNHDEQFDLTQRYSLWQLVSETIFILRCDNSR